MEAQVSMKATPDEFRLIREAVMDAAETAEHIAKLTPSDPEFVSPAYTRAARDRAARLREIEGRL